MCVHYLVGSLDHFLFFPLGIINPTDFHIFQRDWNHQLVTCLISFCMASGSVYGLETSTFLCCALCFQAHWIQLSDCALCAVSSAVSIWETRKSHWRIGKMVTNLSNNTCHTYNIQETKLKHYPFVRRPFQSRFQRWTDNHDPPETLGFVKAHGLYNSFRHLTDPYCCSVLGGHVSGGKTLRCLIQSLCQRWCTLSLVLDLRSNRFLASNSESLFSMTVISYYFNFIHLLILLGIKFCSHFLQLPSHGGSMPWEDPPKGSIRI